MLSLLLKFTLGSKSAFLFWKLLVSEFLLAISEILHCSVSAPRVKIVPLLDVHQLLMLFAETLTYSEPGTFSSVIFYNVLSLLLLLVLLFLLFINVYIYFSISPCFSLLNPSVSVLVTVLCRLEREHPVEPFNFLFPMQLLLAYSLPRNSIVKAPIALVTTYYVRVSDAVVVSVIISA
jgi:hypothetical protein